MKHFVLLVVAVFAIAASAQQPLRPHGLLNRARLRSEPPAHPLVELMPFTNAVASAKAGDGAGFYAVAIHYALGREIRQDNAIATKYLAKAVSNEYPAAVLLDAMVSETRLDKDMPGPRLLNGPHFEGEVSPPIVGYTGGANSWQFKVGDNHRTSFTNVADVAAVKARYAAAIKLGVNAATNELARFEKRVSIVQAGIQKKIDEANAHQTLLDKNARLAKDLIGEDPDVEQKKKEKDEVKPLRRSAAAALDRNDVDREAQAKRAAALEELSGWPLAYNGRSFVLDVYGTNVQHVITECANGIYEFLYVDVAHGVKSCFSLVASCEKEFNVIFTLDCENVTNLKWECSKGKGLIDVTTFMPRASFIDTPSLARRGRLDVWRKYDETGRLVKWGHKTHFPEYEWMTNMHAIVSARLRLAWGRRHGLTREQAEKRVHELVAEVAQSERERGSLAARRRQRQLLADQAERDARRQAEREAERAEQRQQLLAIQEDLERVRAAKSVHQE